MTERGPLRRPAWVRRLPTMTLRRRLVVAFVGLVAIAVALVGGITYSATVSTFNAEMDRALVSAATTIVAGGTVSTTEDRAGEGAGPHGSADPIITLVQHIAPDGTVTVVQGATAPLPVDAAQLALAADPAGGLGRFDRRSIGDQTFRVYTQSAGDGRGAVVVGRNLADASRVLTSIAVTTLVIALTVIAVAALAGWWLARQITRRLAALSTAAETVADTGDLDVPITAQGADEVGRLAASMRAMLAQLAGARQAQRQLVEDAGHELRTPITSLRTNAQVLRRYGELGEADRGRLLDDIDGELRDLTALVNELVELATDSHPAEAVQEVRIGRLLEKVAGRVSRRSGRAVTVRDDGCAIRVQPHSVERAVGNLLENAAKFDPGGSAPIEVSAETTADGVTIRVSDRGPGVPPADLERIFDRFHRGESARGLPGSGLGLAIVRDVADRHGGTAVAAARPGGGLVISLTLTDQP